MEIKEKSFNWWLVKNFTNTYKWQIEEGVIDSCSYRGRVVRGFLALILSSIFAAFIIFTGLFIASGYGLYIAEDGFDFTIFATLLVIAWIIIGCILCDIAKEYEFEDWMPDWLYIELFSKKESKEPSFVGQSYRQIREKFCTKVSFRD